MTEVVRMAEEMWTWSSLSSTYSRMCAPCRNHVLLHSIAGSFTLFSHLSQSRLATLRGNEHAFTRHDARSRCTTLPKPTETGAQNYMTYDTTRRQKGTVVGKGAHARTKNRYKTDIQLSTNLDSANKRRIAGPRITRHPLTSHRSNCGL